MNEYVTNLKGKIIRDSLHGDIFIPNKFIDIIDTPEFQRLRRIKQLALANLIFPGAEHTRFSHSIGTYHIMTKLISHFKEILQSLSSDEIKISTRDTDLALVAALIHDIGHGPFSHTFEDISNINKEYFKHEDWTIEIIRNKESNINKVLTKNFDSNFPDDVATLICKQRNVEENGISLKDMKKIDLNFILSTLISSQLDADRIDYLLRDSLNTGVKYGTIDISKIISSMTITTNENIYCICILEKYLSDIEQYLIGRYQMYKEVYYNKFKCEIELLIKKIFYRAKELYLLNKLELSFIPNAIVSLFKEQSITLDDYIALDDYLMLGLFNIWEKSNDKILSYLCACIINRIKFDKIELMDTNKENINDFKKNLITIFENHGYYIADLNNEYFWLEVNIHHKVYNLNTENILILNKNGILTDLSEASKIITNEIDETSSMMFISYDLLEHIHKFNDVNLLSLEIKNLIKKYSSINHIEIERKYSFNEYLTFENIVKTIIDCQKYAVKENNLQKQTDYYYDTVNKLLSKSNITLRIREKNNNCYLTIKKPIPNYTNKKLVSNERFEHEIPIYSKNLVEYYDFISKYIPEINSSDKFINTLTVINNRTSFDISKDDIKFEMSFDDVIYKNSNGNSFGEYQLEIELKSNYIHKINLKLLCDYIEETIGNIEETIESKYNRGLRLTFEI